MGTQKSVELNIELNGKGYRGRTAFHWACINSHSKKAGVIMQNSTKCDIDQISLAKQFFIGPAKMDTQELLNINMLKQVLSLCYRR